MTDGTKYGQGWPRCVTVSDRHWSSWLICILTEVAGIHVEDEAKQIQSEIEFGGPDAAPSVMDTAQVE